MAADLTVIGKYELLDRLGKGGMGAVYLARDPGLDRFVAIKVLAGDFDNEDLRERFSREARAISRLRHPNIVTIFEHDLGGQPFIAMEYVSGESWAELIGRRAPLPVPRRLQMMEELCAGMAYAHRHKIVHRDLKPANIMVDEEARSIKILDFGIARNLESNATSTLVVGTPRYMSPEQTTGKGIDHRSDVFAVGTVFYELLSYRQAFEGEVQDEVIEKVRHSNPRPLGEVCPGIDTKLVEIVGTAMAKNPGDRYQDLELMRAAIHAVREHPQGRGTPLKHRPGHIKFLATAAEQALADGDYESVLEYCEQVLSVDAAHAVALDLTEKARIAMEDLAVEAFVQDARRQFDQNAVTAAEQLVSEALKLRGTFSPAVALQRELQQARRERARAQERAAAAQAAILRARVNLIDGALESAFRAASEALAHDPALTEAQDLKDQAATALAARVQRDKQEEIDRRALGFVDQARQEFTAGHQAEVLERLAAFSPPHTIVTSALAELRQEWDSVVQRRIEEKVREREAQEGARQELQRRIELLLTRAREQIEAGQFDGAVTTLAEVKTLDSAIPELQELLRKLETGRLAAAELIRRRHGDAQREREAADRREQQQWLDERIRSAKVALEGGKLEAAVAILEEVRRRDPRAPGLVEIQAAADNARAQQIVLKREAEASRRLQAIAEASDSIDALLSTGRLEEAEHALREAERSFGTAEMHLVRQRLSTARSVQRESIASLVRPAERLATRNGRFSRFSVWVIGLVATVALIFGTTLSLRNPGDKQGNEQPEADSPGTGGPARPSPPIGKDRESTAERGGARGIGAGSNSGAATNPATAKGAPTAGSTPEPVLPPAVPPTPEPLPTSAAGPPVIVPAPTGGTSGSSSAQPVGERGLVAAEPPLGAATGGATRISGSPEPTSIELVKNTVAAIIEQYRLGYVAKSITEIQQVFPSATIANTFGNAHKQCSKVFLTLEIIRNQPSPESAPDKAYVATKSAYSCHDGRRLLEDPPRVDMFELEKKDGSWRIVDLKISRGK